MKCQFCEAEAAYRLDLGKQYPKSKEHGGVVGRCVQHLAPWNRTIAEPIHDADYPPVVEDAVLEEPERPAPPEEEPTVPWRPSWSRIPTPPRAPAEPERPAPPEEEPKRKRAPRKKASPAPAEFDPA